LPASGVLYVDPSAAPGGDGSMQAPYTSVAAAVLAASSSATVALSKASHAIQGALLVHGRARIVGACADQTSIAVGDHLHLSGGAIILQNLGVVASGRAITVGPESARLELSEVIISSTATTAIAVVGGAALSATRAYVLADENVGLRISAGGHAYLSRTAFERSGIDVQSATLEARDLAVRRFIEPTQGAPEHYGVHAISSAIGIDRALFDGVTTGVRAEAGSRARLDGLASRSAYAGVHVLTTSSVATSRMLVLGGAGVVVVDAGSFGSLSDAVLTTTVTSGGFAISADAGAVFRAERIMMSGPFCHASVMGSDAQSPDNKGFGTMSDLDADLPAFPGCYEKIQVFAGSLDARRVRATMQAGAAIALHVGATAKLEDLSIDGARPAVWVQGTFGGDATERAQLARASFTHAIGAAMCIDESSAMSAEDVRVTEATGEWLGCVMGMRHRAFGSGVMVAASGKLGLARFEITGTSTAVVAWGPNVSLASGTIEDNAYGMYAAPPFALSANVVGVVFRNRVNYTETVP
jgi:hypothetical protein